jgi:hypothetical protein
MTPKIPQNDEAKNLELLADIRAGKATRNDLAERNIGLANHQVTLFRRRWKAGCVPKQRRLDPCPSCEDCESIAYETLAVRCGKIRLDHPYPSRYLSCWIRRDLEKIAAREHWSSLVPRRTPRTGRPCGIVRLASSEDQTDPGIHFMPPEKNDNLDRVALDDLVEKACHDSLDHEIVEHRKESYTIDEIARLVGRSPSVVHRRLSHVRGRVELLMEGATVEEALEKTRIRRQRAKFSASNPLIDIGSTDDGERLLETDNDAAAGDRPEPGEIAPFTRTDERTDQAG